MALKLEEMTAPPGESRNEIIAKYKQQKARKKKSKSAKKYREREEAQMKELLEAKAKENSSNSEAELELISEEAEVTEEIQQVDVPASREQKPNESQDFTTESRTNTKTSL